MIQIFIEAFQNLNKHAERNSELQEPNNGRDSPYNLFSLLPSRETIPKFLIQYLSRASLSVLDQ